MAASVLVVEDHATTRLVWERELQSAGYRPLAAGTGREALAFLAEETPDISLLDVRLPGRISGLDVAERLRTLSPQAPIVILTGFPDTLALRRGLELRVDAWLEKPVEASVLLDAPHSRPLRCPGAGRRSW